MTFYSRKPTRIPNYDYSSENYYFITICTHNRKCIFGIPDQLSKIGTIAYQEIEAIPLHYESVYIDKFVVMPNHVHMIMVLSNGNNADAKQIIAQYKAGVTRKVRNIYPDINIWQRSFNDNIISNQNSYEKIWLYIEGNPQNWSKDCFYIDDTFLIM